MNTGTKGFLDCRHVALSFMITLPFCLTPAFAQNPGPGSGQDIQTAVSNVLAQTGNLADKMNVLCQDDACQNSAAGKMFKAKVDQMKGAQARAVNANNRATAADYDKINRRKGKNKHDDGCDPNVQICVADTSSQVTASSSSSEPEIDDGTGQDVIANLNDVSSNVDTLTTQLATNVPPPPPITVDPLTDAEYFFPPAMWPSETVVWAAFNANQAAEKVAELAKPACDETLVALGEGGNGSMACLATEGIYMVVNYAYEAMEFIVRARANAEITGAYERLGNVYDNLKSMSDGTAYIEQRVEEIEKNQAVIVANQHYLMQLLTLPEGKRPGFPTGDGASASPAKASVIIGPTPPGH
jgi:hypothetical protein